MAATQGGGAERDATGQRALGTGWQSQRTVIRGDLPTSARLSPDLGTAGESRSRVSAWILRKRSLRSVFCARAWNMLKNSRALLVNGQFRKTQQRAGHKQV